MSEASWTQMAKVESLHPELQGPVLTIIARLYLRGFKPKMFFGWRSLETQARLLRRKTSTLNISFHNNVDEDDEHASLAADIVDADRGWDHPEFFEALGEEAKAVGLVWGGDWRNPDSAHVQLWPNSRLDEVRTVH